MKPAKNKKRNRSEDSTERPLVILPTLNIDSVASSSYVSETPSAPRTYAPGTKRRRVYEERRREYEVCRRMGGLSLGGGDSVNGSANDDGSTCNTSTGPGKR